LNRLQKTILLSLASSSAIKWVVAGLQQDNMMAAMSSSLLSSTGSGSNSISLNPIAISLFTAIWTAGMAAMMFPAITSMVLMYNRFVTNRKNNRGGQSSVTIEEEHQQRDKSTSSFPSLRVILFVGSYLLVWAITGISLLLLWSAMMNNTIMTTGNTVFIHYLYGSLLIVAGAYQFTPLKRICIGYCESPMSFFMRRWRDGTSGAFKMGVYHGVYCLRCCWAYFLLMVALGWMNVLWMGLFAGIIFGEKMWSRGIWVARAAGVGLAIVGILVAAGMLPSLMSATTSMSNSEEGIDDMSTMMKDDDAGNNNNNMAMSDSSSKASVDISDDSVASIPTNDESDQKASDHDGQSGEFKDNYNSNGQTKMMGME
jgi:predicted metal-binding membrane protein